MITLETVNDMLTRHPFEPFRLILTSGTTYDIQFPGLVAAGATRLIYCLPRSDQFVIIPLMQIAAVETLQPHPV